MIRLRTLGTLGLTRPDGVEVHSVLSQPKRAALLVYLACARPRGFHNREELLACFWPELDEKRARAALSAALYRLRKGVGHEVVVSRGDAVGVDPERLWCDAVALDAHLEGEDAEAAVRLYGGEFLVGFHTTGTPDFEEWLSGERRVLRRRAAEACRRLIEAAPTLQEAERWARHAVTLDPLDEAVSIRLMELLARAGNRGGALREYDRLAHALRATVDVAPASGTSAVAEAIRQGAEPRHSPEEETTPRPREPSAAPSRLVEPEIRVPLPPRGRRRWGAGVAAAAAVTVSLAAAWHVAASGALSAAQERRVAVLPFEFRGDSALAHLGPTAGRHLADALREPGLLEPADPNAVFGHAGRGGEGRDPRGHGRRVARRVGAARFVVGRVAQLGDGFHLEADAYDRAGEPVASAAVRAPGEAELLPAVERLARELLVRLEPDPGGVIRAAAEGTSSLAALKAFVVAERAFRQGRWTEAMSAAEKAIVHDSLFALAHHRKWIVADWIGRYPDASEAARRTWELRDRLPDPQRRLAVAGWHGRRGQQGQAIRVLREAIRWNPEDAEAWAALAEALFHADDGTVQPAEIEAALRRVVELAPRHPVAHLHLARLAAQQRDLDALEEWTREALLRGASGKEAVELRALNAFATGDAAAIERSVSDLRELDDESLVQVVRRTIGFTGEFRTVRAATALLREPIRAVEVRAMGTVLDAYLDAAGGRDPLARYDAAEALRYPRLHVLARGLLAATAAAPIAPADLRTVQADLAALRTGGAAHRPTAILEADGLTAPPTMPALLYGLVSVRLGDAAAAEDAVAELERIEPGTRGGRLVRAALGRAQNEPHLALQILGPVPSGLVSSEPAGIEVFLRAELLRETGRVEEALRIYSAFIQDEVFAALYLAPSHLRRAEIHHRRGERQRALEHLARARELWRDAHPELLTRLDEMERRLELERGLPAR